MHFLSFVPLVLFLSLFPSCWTGPKSFRSFSSWAQNPSEDRSKRSTLLQDKEVRPREGEKYVEMGCHIPGDRNHRRAVRVHRHCGRGCGYRPIPLLPVHRHLCGDIPAGALCRKEDVLGTNHGQIDTDKKTRNRSQGRVLVAPLKNCPLPV